MVVGTISIYTKLKNNYTIMNILKNGNKTKSKEYVPLHKRMHQSIIAFTRVRALYRKRWILKNY